MRGPHQEQTPDYTSTGGDLVFSSQIEREPVFQGGTHILQFPSQKTRRVSLTSPKDVVISSISSPEPVNATGAGTGSISGNLRSVTTSSVGAGKEVPLTAKIATIVPKSLKVDLSDDIE